MIPPQTHGPRLKWTLVREKTGAFAARLADGSPTSIAALGLDWPDDDESQASGASPAAPSVGTVSEHFESTGSHSRQWCAAVGPETDLLGATAEASSPQWPLRWFRETVISHFDESGRLCRVEGERWDATEDAAAARFRAIRRRTLAALASEDGRNGFARVGGYLCGEGLFDTVLAVSWEPGEHGVEVLGRHASVSAAVAERAAAALATTIAAGPTARIYPAWGGDVPGGDLWFDEATTLPELMALEPGWVAAAVKCAGGPRPCRRALVMLRRTSPLCRPLARRVLDALGPAIGGAWRRWRREARLESVERRLERGLRQVESVNTALFQFADSHPERAVEGLLRYMVDRWNLQAAWVIRGAEPAAAQLLAWTSQVAGLDVPQSEDFPARAFRWLLSSNPPAATPGFLAAAPVPALESWFGKRPLAGVPLQISGVTEGGLFLAQSPRAASRILCDADWVGIARALALGLSQDRMRRSLTRANTHLAERAESLDSEIKAVHDLGEDLAVASDAREASRAVFRHLERVMPIAAGVLLLATEPRPVALAYCQSPLDPTVRRVLLNAASQPVGGESEFGEPRWEWCVEPNGQAPALKSVEGVQRLALRTSIHEPALGAIVVATHAGQPMRSGHLRLLFTIARQATGTLDRVRRRLDVEEQRIAALIREIPIGIVLLGEGDSVLMMNAGAERLLGLGEPGVWPARLSRIGAVDFAELAAQGAPVTTLLSPRAEPGRDPSVRLVEIAVHTPAHTGPLRRGDSVVVLRDVTEERELQARALEQDRLASVGQLASGLAHDFRNALSVILGYTDLVAEGLPGDSTFQGDLAQVKEAGQLGVDLVQQLLAFASDETPALGPVDLNAQVRTFRQVATRLIGEHVEMVVELAPALPETHSDASLLKRILMNLVLNARDAMTAGGTLRLTTYVPRPEELIDPALSLDPRRRYVALRVEDSGTGMSPETFRRMFEPFYTTKGRGEGTGLGLLMVQTSVRQLGGALRAHSVEGTGTRFDLFFPCDAPRIESSEGETLGTDAPSRHLILVVEDDQHVRTLVDRMLREAGHDVLLAGNGVEALRVLEAEPRTVDIVLTDVVMPEMGGIELVATLHPNHRDLRFIYMTGYAPPAAESAMIAGQVPILHKPFDRAALLRSIDQVLAEPPTPPMS